MLLDRSSIFALLDSRGNCMVVFSMIICIYNFQDILQPFRLNDLVESIHIAPPSNRWREIQWSLFPPSFALATHTYFTLYWKLKQKTLPCRWFMDVKQFPQKTFFLNIYFLGLLLVINDFKKLRRSLLGLDFLYSDVLKWIRAPQCFVFPILFFMLFVIGRWLFHQGPSLKFYTLTYRLPLFPY